MKPYNGTQRKEDCIYNSTHTKNPGDIREIGPLTQTGQLGQLHMAGSVPWSDSQQQLQSTMQTLLKPIWKCKNLQQGDHHCCLPGRKGYRGKERGLVSSLLFRKEEP